MIWQRRILAWRKSGIKLKTEKFRLQWSLQNLVKEFGGFAKKVMNGKLELLIEQVEKDAHIVLMLKFFQSITIWKLKNLILFMNGIQLALILLHKGERDDAKLCIKNK